MVQSLEISLKWGQQDGSNNKGDEQSIHALANVLPVASPAQGEHAAGTGNQEEQWYPPGVDRQQNAHDGIAFYRVVYVSRRQRIKGPQDMINEDAKNQDIAQPIEIVKALWLFGACFCNVRRICRGHCVAGHIYSPGF